MYDMIHSGTAAIIHQPVRSMYSWYLQSRVYVLYKLHTTLSSADFSTYQTPQSIRLTKAIAHSIDHARNHRIASAIGLQACRS